MRIYQTWRDFAAQLVLVRDVPLLAPFVRRKLVDLHVERYQELSERDEMAREPRFRALFETALDVYVRASEEGYPEIQAREIAHILGTFDFLNHGWGELIEFPPREVEDYHERYAEFYDRYDCTPENPFGRFAPAGGFPAAPRTPERMAGAYTLAEPGLADDVYVLAPGLDRRLPNGDAPKGDLHVPAAETR
ncbi:MAG: DUF6149 family protein [Haloarculaceae archaeon]